MRNIKSGDTGQSVKELQSLLGINISGNFDTTTEKAVRDYQKSNGLVCDGVVGYSTWKSLFTGQRGTIEGSISNNDYVIASKLLDCDIASIKVIQAVETGGSSGFIAPGKPKILFEGHVFWRELKARNIDPLKIGQSDILYPTWTKSYYKGGIKEYDRLERARRINVDAANSSASWGMFQVMGNNYKSCGCNSVSEFVKLMCSGEFAQLLLTINFIMNNPRIHNALRLRDWVLFAKYYNGPGQVAVYSERLKKAYENIKKTIC